MGFELNEVMEGEHEFEQGCGPTGKHPILFNVNWGPDSFFDWVNPSKDDFLRQPLEGTITVGGLCKDADCYGSLELRYFKDKSIRYQFGFSANDTEYVFVGEKVNIKPWNLMTSHTTCFGTIKEKESGKLISRSVTYFKLKSLFSFLTSFRLV